MIAWEERASVGHVGWVSRFGPWLLALAATGWLGLLWEAPRRAAQPAGVGRAVSAIAYAAGARLCHQRPGRSFSRNGAPLPVCARCAGLYVGGALGALAAAALGASALASAGRYRRALGLVLGPTAIAWTAEWLGGVEVTNGVRAVAALPAGAAVGWMLVVALRGWRGEGPGSSTGRPGTRVS